MDILSHPGHGNSEGNLPTVLGNADAAMPTGISSARLRVILRSPALVCDFNSIQTVYVYILYPWPRKNYTRNYFAGCPAIQIFSELFYIESPSVLV